MINLKKALTDYGYTQKELSDKSGIAYTTVCKVCNGQYTPSERMKNRLAITFGKMIGEKVSAKEMFQSC